MKNKLILGVLAVAGATVFLSNPTSATINPDIQILDREYGYAVSPASVDFDIAPGTTTSETLQLRNTGQSEIKVMIGVSPLTVLDESYASTNVTEFSPRTEIVRWTTVSIDDGCSAYDTDSEGNLYVQLRVQEECYVRYSVDTPSSAPSGSQHMNMFFRLYEGEPESQTGIQAIQSIGINMYAQNDHGDAKTCVDVKKQHIPFWVFSGPLNTSYVAENCGNLDTYVESYLEVRNLLGNTVYKSYAEEGDKWSVTSADQRRIVLTDTSRLVDINWDEAGLGIFKVIQTVKAGDQTFEKVSHVFLIPLWMLIAVLICLFVIIASIVYSTKKRKQTYSRSRR